jgi:hypothetical protein
MNKPPKNLDRSIDHRDKQQLIQAKVKDTRKNSGLNNAKNGRSPPQHKTQHTTHSTRSNTSHHNTTQHTTHNIQHTTQHTTYSTQHTTHNTHNTTYLASLAVRPAIGKHKAIEGLVAVKRDGAWGEMARGNAAREVERELTHSHPRASGNRKVK